MADPGPPPGDNPFEGPFEGPFEAMPFLQELLRMLSAQRPGWETARQVAASLATGGTSEPNVDPAVRLTLEELGRVAELQVTQATGLDLSGASGRPAAVLACTRATWAERTLDAYRPLLETVTGTLGSPQALAGLDDPDDPMGAWLVQFLTSMAPTMAAASAGSMVGHLAARAFGSYDLPIPRAAVAAGDEVLVCVRNVDAFAQDWELPLDEVRLWVCVHELAFHAVVSVPHVQEQLSALLRAHAAGFRPDPEALQEQLGDLDLDLSSPDMSQLADLQRSLRPEAVLGAMQSPEQRELLPRLEAVTGALIGFVDHTMDGIGARLMPAYARITEAMRRRRVEFTEADRFVEQLLGINLTRRQVERGHQFVRGVIERAGDGALARLFETEHGLPTPSELEAPGLWLARLDLPAT